MDTLHCGPISAVGAVGVGALGNAARECEISGCLWAQSWRAPGDVTSLHFSPFLHFSKRPNEKSPAST